MMIMNGRTNEKGYSLYKASFYTPHTRAVELKTFRCKNMIELKRLLSVLESQGYEYDPALIPFQKVEPKNWEKHHEDCLVRG